MPDSSQWSVLAELAAKQHGVVAREQVRTRITSGQLHRLVKRGILIPMARGVWKVATARGTWQQDVMAACLAAGPDAAASHLSAARIWQLDGIATNKIHLTVPPGRSARRALDLRGVSTPVVAHHSCVAPSETCVRDDLRVTTPARTIGDLAGLVPAGALAKATDDAMRRRLLTLETLDRARRRRGALRGAVALDEILEDRRSLGVGESPGEDRVYRWIVPAGLPRPHRQFPVTLPSMPARLDMAYPDYRVAIEFDGYHWHRERESFDRDRRRSTELAVLGWLVVNVTSRQRREGVISTIRAALVSRGWSPSPIG